MVDEPDQMSVDPYRVAAETTVAPAESEARQAEVFEAFYREHLPRLAGFLVNRGATAVDAAEIAQEAMIRAWKSWTVVEFPRAWVFKVAVRILGERLRTIRDTTPSTGTAEQSVLISLPAIASRKTTAIRQARYLARPYRAGLRTGLGREGRVRGSRRHPHEPGSVGVERKEQRWQGI
ncbi:sigma factor [Nocardia sp. NPDC050697]|uniref:RNA polymerase sigma factor n=1 Tax=Nocardia sp. NPDC050697 TaxID=3155158 RepID=UPI00340232FE